jgi:hypothetical protein
LIADPKEADVSTSKRDTNYATEIATVKLPSGDTGSSWTAIERIFVKHLQQEEIRFSWWEGPRMMPRPLDLPERELLPLMREAIIAGVFSLEFLEGLRDVLEEVQPQTVSRNGVAAETAKRQNHRLRTFQVFARYADSQDWEHLGVWELEFVPRIGERITRDVGDHGHAFQVVSLHHPEGGAVDGADLFVVDLGTISTDMRRLFNECGMYVTDDRPFRDDAEVPPGYKPGPDT